MHGCMAHVTAQSMSDWLGVFGHHFLGRGGGGPISWNKVRAVRAVRARKTDGAIRDVLKACPFDPSQETETCPATKSFSKEATFSCENTRNELHIQKKQLQMSDTWKDIKVLLQLLQYGTNLPVLELFHSLSEPGQWWATSQLVPGCGRHRSGIHCDFATLCHITGTWGAQFCILLAFSLHLLPPATKTGTHWHTFNPPKWILHRQLIQDIQTYSNRIMSHVQWIINDNHPRYSSTFILGICWLSLGMKKLNIPVNLHGSWFLIDRL